jgi:NADH-quinone oxidoreductase subunit G
VQRILRDCSSSNVDCSSSPVDPALLGDLSRPELGSRMSDLDNADAILVIGTDPLHEMPILDLRIRKAVRRSRTKLMVASERPTTLDGGAAEAVRYAPGDAASFVRALAGALGAEGYETRGPFEKEAAAIAEALRGALDQVIVWGERLWRTPGAVEALHACARELDMHQRIGPGLLEVPEASNGRGLREVGCLPGATPGLRPTEAGRASAEIKDGLASHELSALLLVNSDPVRTHPDTEGWRQALAGSFVVSIAGFDDESTRYADIVIPAETHAEKEGTVTHPDGRLQRLRRNVPLPEGLRPGWRFLADVSAALGNDLGLDTAADVFDALSTEVPFYDTLTYEEIGGTGFRWSDRDPGASWTPPAGTSASAERAHVAAGPGHTETPSPTGGESVSEADAGGAAGGDRNGLVLGTYRDLWATDVTKRNPALRFLMPKQRLELAPKDADRLELGNGDLVTVSVNGSSIEATVAIRQRMREGAAFLIEGTDEANANVLTNGVPQRIEVSKR